MLPTRYDHSENRRSRAATWSMRGEARVYGGGTTKATMIKCKPGHSLMQAHNFTNMWAEPSRGRGGGMGRASREATMLDTETNSASAVVAQTAESSFGLPCAAVCQATSCSLERLLRRRSASSLSFVLTLCILWTELRSLPARLRRG